MEVSKLLKSLVILAIIVIVLIIVVGILSFVTFNQIEIIKEYVTHIMIHFGIP